MNPPIDPDFYAIGANSGMTDEEIQADWDAYCEDLGTFHAELEKKQPVEALDEMKKFFTEQK